MTTVYSSARSNPTHFTTPVQTDCIRNLRNNRRNGKNENKVGGGDASGKMFRFSHEVTERSGDSSHRNTVARWSESQRK
ncbi:hypothetical protein TNCT_263981 [Trichonephila clavata]|uniref:Uncharacterized protein n=1 Tax=Trichonephila clavata TaxID=2740835 RepID=A0A8X6J468_TRICU|nr:hypothetical protein TNCT_263981 [Trichonephila clavata]